MSAKWINNNKKTQAKSENKPKIHKPWIKADKLGRIYNIVWLDNPTVKTPECFKDALNHFRGRQMKANLPELLKYIKLSLVAQSNEPEAAEAAKEITNIHYKWNNSWRARYGEEG